MSINEQGTKDMAYSERTLNILNYLKEHNSASVKALAEMLYVSEATVRRDLSELQKSGQVRRSHGGAVYSDGTDEISIYARQIKNTAEKERAAMLALKLLPDFSTVFIDNSSTCLALAKRIDFSRKTVVTNGLQIALQAARKQDVTLIMPGGEIKHNSSAVTGAAAVEFLKGCRFDIALTSCSALDINGSYEFTLDSMQIKRAALSNAKVKFLIFDSTKIGKTAGFCTSPLEGYDELITDADDEAIKSILSCGVPVINR